MSSVHRSPPEAATGDDLAAPASPPVPAATSLGGLGIYAVALLIFACQDGVTKHLVQTHSPALVSAVRFVAQVALLGAVLPRPLRALPAPPEGTSASARRWLVLLRSLCLSGLTLVMMGAYARMPLAEATAIMFLAPLLVTLAAIPLLRETPGPLRWVGSVGGFLGLLLILRPGGNLDSVGVALAFAGALLNAGYQLLSRLLQGIAPLTLLFHSAATGAVVGVGMVLLGGGPGAVSPADLGVMALLAVSGGVGHFLLTVAFRRADASLLAPMTYLQLVFAAGVGWAAFHQFPDHVALAGMLLICASGVMAVLDSRRTIRPAPLEV